MTNDQKKKIQVALQDYMTQTAKSQSKVANEIGDGISVTVINHITSGRYTQGQIVSDKNFQRVSTFLGLDKDWVIVHDDDNFMKIQEICHEAQSASESYAISAPPGHCKSEASKDYASRVKKVFYVKCSAHFTKKVFLLQIVKALGLTAESESIAYLNDFIIDRLNSMNRPLLIIDEADKLSDALFQFFITFYNDTPSCGYVFLGSNFFRLRVIKNVNKDKMGYSEFFSRIGRQFVALKALTPKRIKVICVANGITDDAQISEVINKSENDMRRIRRLVLNFRRENNLEKKVQPSLNLN